MIRDRMQAWMQKTHGLQFELVRHFLSQLLATHLTSSDQARRYVIAAVAFVACLDPLVVRLYTDKYAYLQSLPDGGLYLAAVRADRIFFITISMAVALLVTMFQWQSLFPSREDYLNLKPLPVRLYQVFAARFFSSLLVIAVVNAVLNFGASVLFPLLGSGRWQLPGFGGRYILAHAVATMGAGFFVFFTLTALQGVCLNLLPSRPFERVSLLLQVLLVIATLSSLPYVFDMPNWHLLLAARPRWLEWFPAAWFEGLYQYALGSRDAYLLHQARRAGLYSLAAATATCLAYVVSYQRYASRLLESSTRRSAGESKRIWTRLLERMIRSSRELAVVDFVVCGLSGSRRHKLLVAFAVGAAIVLSIQPIGPILLHGRSEATLEAWQLRAVLAVPLVMGSIVVSSLYYVLQQPLELRANWIFRTAESAGRLDLLNGVERFLRFFGILPVLLASLPVEILASGILDALAHELFAAVFLLLLVELRLREWHKIPFTCSYISGRRNIWQTVGAYFALFVAVIPVTAYFEAWLRRPLLILACAVLLTGVYVFLRVARQRQWDVVPLLFEETEEALIGGIGLRRE